MLKYSLMRNKSDLIATLISKANTTRTMNAYKNIFATEMNMESNSSKDSNMDMDEVFIKKMSILDLMDNVGRDVKSKKGHSFSDFVTYCAWNGIQCHKG